MGLISFLILGGGLLTNAVYKQDIMQVSLLDYSFGIPKGWVAISGRDEIKFEKDYRQVAGIQIVSYEPGKPVNSILANLRLFETPPYDLDNPKSSTAKPTSYRPVSNKTISGLATDAILFNVDSSPDDSNQVKTSQSKAIVNENHLYLLFAKDKLAYDIYGNSRYVDERQLLKIAESITPYGGYNASELLKYKTKYVGDNSKVGNIISNLPFANIRGTYTLTTSKKPYGVTVNYIYGHGAIPKDSDSDVNKIMQNNAAVMFSLIDNVDWITFIWTIKRPAKKNAPTCSECHSLGTAKTTQKKTYSYTREKMQSRLVNDMRDYAKNKNTFRGFLDGLKR
jgi:hypothetical protein